MPHKTLASIAQIFNFKTTPKKKIMLENALISEMSQESESINRMEPIDNIVYNTFVKKFNNEYGGKLLEEQKDFRMELLEGRAVATGNFLSQEIGLLILLTRSVHCSLGKTGISEDFFKYLIKCLSKRISPAIPEFGSIGAGDLTQNAHFGLSLLGKGKLWKNKKVINADKVLKEEKLLIPKIKGKDTMVLLNHSSLSIVLSALAIRETKTCIKMIQLASLMSLEAFGANPQIFHPKINNIRKSPGQKRIASWFYNILSPTKVMPRRIQDPLSFRTISVVLGMSIFNLTQSINILENELNGISDSPVILKDNNVCSTPNFHNPALAISMESISLNNSMLANGSVQRMQRMMDSKISGLPNYLSPIGGQSAGFVPSQKTAVSLLAEIKQHSLPISFDTVPVSEGVEDTSSMTPASAKKLSNQSKLMKLVAGLECLVASQAIDLRYGQNKNFDNLSSITKKLWQTVRKKIDKIDKDRPMEGDINNCTNILEKFVLDENINLLMTKKESKIWNQI